MATTANKPTAGAMETMRPAITGAIRLLSTCCTTTRTESASRTVCRSWGAGDQKGWNGRDNGADERHEFGQAGNEAQGEGRRYAGEPKSCGGENANQQHGDELAGKPALERLARIVERRIDVGLDRRRHQLDEAVAIEARTDREIDAAEQEQQERRERTRKRGAPGDDTRGETAKRGGGGAVLDQVCHGTELKIAQQPVGGFGQGGEQGAHLGGEFRTQEDNRSSKQQDYERAAERQGNALTEAQMGLQGRRNGMQHDREENRAEEQEKNVGQRRNGVR